MQLPFKAAKFDVVVEEPGLGDIYGTHIVLKAQVLAGQRHSFMDMLSYLLHRPDRLEVTRSRCRNAIRTHADRVKLPLVLAVATCLVRLRIPPGLPQTP